MTIKYKGAFIRPLRGMGMKKGIVFAVALVFGVLFISGASASLAQFQGTWTNVDSGTSGITKLKVDVSGSKVAVQAWGKCHPTDCDWGTAKGVAFAPSVGSDLINDANAVLAVFPESFKKTTLVLTLSGSRLDVISLSEFTDSSGRTNYASKYTFARAPATPVLTTPGLAGLARTPVITTTALVAPTQLAPKNNEVFNHYPRDTTLQWMPVSGAASYTVEIDCYHCCESNKWCTDVGKTWKVVPGIEGTTYSFSFVGAQPGRWRVWAIGPGGEVGPKSGWWQFSYTR